MNNTTTKRNLALVAVFMAATLVVGTLAATTTIATTQTAFAFSKRNDKKEDGSGNGNGNTVTIQECKQAATQSGFDNNQGQECENVICTHPGENATCVQEGLAAATPTPVKLSCEDCFRKFLSKTQLDKLIGQFPLEQICALLSRGTITLVGFEALLAALERVTGPIDIDGLIQCLRDAGIVFSTRGEA